MKKRIEYIDAIRGFTMIFVVFSHIIGFSLGDETMAYNDIIAKFRMPLFFLSVVGCFTSQNGYGMGKLLRNC